MTRKYSHKVKSQKKCLQCICSINCTVCKCLLSSLFSSSSSGGCTCTQMLPLLSRVALLTVPAAPPNTRARGERKRGGDGCLLYIKY